ncbi:hypothetical protein SE956_01340 [Escherichia coli]|nr:hypothetical protein [Escherichia coli]
MWDLTKNMVDVYSGSPGANPKVDIKLLMVSVDGNLTVKKRMAVTLSGKSANRAACF